MARAQITTGAILVTIYISLVLIGAVNPIHALYFFAALVATFSLKLGVENKGGVTKTFK